MLQFDEIILKTFKLGSSKKVNFFSVDSVRVDPISSEKDSKTSEKNTFLAKKTLILVVLSLSLSKMLFIYSSVREVNNNKFPRN